MRPPTSRALRSGRRYQLVATPLFLLPHYHVLTFDHDDPTPDETTELLALAWEAARTLACARYGDPGCFTVLCHGERTRRRPWFHCHIVPTHNLRSRRRALFLLRFKRWLRRF